MPIVVPLYSPEVDIRADPRPLPCRVETASAEGQLLRETFCNLLSSPLGMPTAPVAFITHCLASRDQALRIACQVPCGEGHTFAERPPWKKQPSAVTGRELAAPKPCAGPELTTSAYVTLRICSQQQQLVTMNGCAACDTEEGLNQRLSSSAKMERCPIAAISRRNPALEGGAAEHGGWSGPKQGNPKDRSCRRN